MDYSEIKKSWRKQHYFKMAVDYPNNNPFEGLDWVIYKHYPLGTVERNEPCDRCQPDGPQQCNLIGCRYGVSYRKVKVTVLKTHQQRLLDFIKDRQCEASVPLYQCEECRVSSRRTIFWMMRGKSA